MENKNYECKRCFYNCNQLNDMKKHLNKKIKCIRKLESFNYNDDELYNLLLTKNNNKIIVKNLFLQIVIYQDIYQKIYAVIKIRLK